MIKKYKDLPDGPWQQEPAKLFWKHLGLPCFVLRNNHLGTLCGYVGVPVGNVFYGDSGDSLSVHGGVTWSKVGQPPTAADLNISAFSAYWYLGFDCGHYCDYVPALEIIIKIRQKYDQPASVTYKDIAYVIMETESLAEQLITGGREIAP